MSQAGLDGRFVEGLEWARWAVDRWSEFPVDQTPRPLVMAGLRVVVEGGFASSEAKMAFLNGRLDWAVAVPDRVRSTLDRPVAKPTPGSFDTPLVIVGATKGEARFITDRGPRQLSAWRLDVDGVQGCVWVLDPDLAPWSPRLRAGHSAPQLQPPAQDPFAQIEVGPDDQSVVLQWLGSPAAYESYPFAQSVETDHAVALVARGTDAGRSGVRPAIGHMHRVPARLSAPLGGRVFVDLHGHAGQAIRGPAR